MVDAVGSVLDKFKIGSVSAGNVIVTAFQLLGGILLGIIEIFAKAFNTNISDAVVFLVLIVVLLVKPTGFLGRKVQEKV